MSRGVPTEFYVPKESANVDHIPDLADAELKITESEESQCGPSLPPDRLQIALIPHFHFSAMQNCSLIISSDNSLARRAPAIR
jgi:aminopeptidase N